MKKTRVARLTSVVLVVCAAVSTARLGAAEPEFQLKPSRCIALHAGQTCFQTITFIWSLPRSHNYCLFEVSVDKPLYCWLNGGRGRFRYQFESQSSSAFRLVREDGELVAERVLEVSWVYRNNRKSSSGWRLF